MKTDTLFYELFQAAPHTFFELIQKTPLCPYKFESITIKASEKRIDGVLEPAQAGQPIYFLEVQGFPDDVIYWREMREVATYFEQRPQLKGRAWQAFVLWLNKADDPGLGTLRLVGRKPRPRLVSLDLIDILGKLPPASVALNVLRPLLAKDVHEVREHVVEWVENIRRAPDLDQASEERLISVLSQLIEQKFRTFSYKELSRMLRLTPLRETISGQELLKEDRVEMLTRQIQRKFDLTPELFAATVAELNQLALDNLRALIDAILFIDTFEQLEHWIAAHLPTEQG
jgi:predicted transposase YdaD